MCRSKCLRPKGASIYSDIDGATNERFGDFIFWSSLKEKPDPVLLGQILKRLSSRSAVSINIPMKPLTIKLAKVLNF